MKNPASIVLLAIAFMATAVSSGRADDETSRAFAQDKAADLRIEWESDSRLFLRHPKGAEFKSEDALFNALALLKTRHELAVIDMGKPMRMLSDKDFKQRVDMIESRVKKLGFKRVAFHLATASEHPIYRQ